MHNKPKILIVEDEPLIADDIGYMLLDEGYTLTGKAADADEALSLLEKDPPDLILLDISLDGDDDGVDLAHRINRQYGIPFVFITSHSDRLTINRVKKTRPAGFIVKPFRREEILSIVAIALHKTRNKPLLSKDGDTGFFVKDRHDLVKINFEDILFIKALDNYAQIFTGKGKTLTSLNLKSLGEKLPAGRFLRVHRSYVVNLSKITRISHRFVYIDRHEIPLGKGAFQLLQEFIRTL